MPCQRGGTFVSTGLVCSTTITTISYWPASLLEMPAPTNPGSPASRLTSALFARSRRTGSSVAIDRTSGGDVDPETLQHAPDGNGERHRVASGEQQPHNSPLCVDDGRARIPWAAKAALDPFNDHHVVHPDRPLLVDHVENVELHRTHNSLSDARGPAGLPDEQVQRRISGSGQRPDGQNLPGHGDPGIEPRDRRIHLIWFVVVDQRDEAVQGCHSVDGFAAVQGRRLHRTRADRSPVLVRQHVIVAQGIQDAGLLRVDHNHPERARILEPDRLERQATRNAGGQPAVTPLGGEKELLWGPDPPEVLPDAPRSGARKARDAGPC